MSFKRLMKVQKEGQGKLFNQGWLELLTKTNPFIHTVTYGSVVVFSLIKNNQPIPETLVFAISGIIIWTLVEYLIHRFLFHIKASKFQYLIHGVHHEFPRDRERLMMPPLPGLMLVLFFFGLWYLLFQQNVYAFMSGFVSCYVVYTFIHYALHAWKPVKGFKFLWTHHHKHHNPAFEHTSYGVSTPLWDYVFGTMPKDTKDIKGES
ncbi:MAG: sterol desaturase family protein [Bacteroidota bacterium]